MKHPAPQGCLEQISRVPRECKIWFIPEKLQYFCQGKKKAPEAGYILNLYVAACIAQVVGFQTTCELEPPQQAVKFSAQLYLS